VTGRYQVFGSSGVVGHHDEPLVEGPLIVVGRKGNAGAAFLSEEGCWPIDTTYYFSIPEEVDPRFLWYQMQVLGLETKDSSTAIPSLRRPDLESAEVALAPLDEQRRIVEAIETHLSHLDAGVESLGILRAKRNDGADAVPFGNYDCGRQAQT
jgi:type I restriction enzyme, S subunit